MGPNMGPNMGPGMWKGVRLHASLGVTLAGGLLLAGTVSSALLDFDEYLQRGEAARVRGDWESVANQFAQAINHPDLPKDGATRSAMHLEYGRALGVICQYGEAEKYLLLAKDMSEKSGSSTFSALYELGAFNVTRKNFPAAITYFSPLPPIIEKESRAKRSPLLVADALEKFAVALVATGKADEAESRRREAERIRETRPKPAPPGTITPYGAQCPKS